MEDSPNFASAFGVSSALQLTGQLMVIAILVLFVVVVFVIVLHLYARFFWLRTDEAETTSETRRRRPRHRLPFATGRHPTVSNLHGGLDLAVLNSLPVMEVGLDDFKDGMGCAVCLSDIVDGEKARVLPKCNHGFHLDCIDMWFQFHSTCPLCRNVVALDYTDSMGSPLGVDIEAQTESSSSGVPADSPNIPTNVLFWGNQREESPSSSRDSNGSVVIEIPNDAPPPTSSSSSTSTPSGRRLAEEEAKSPAATRLMSLKRILSRETRPLPCNCTSTS